MKRRQTYSASGITVTFDPDVCIHSGICLGALPEVFDVGRRRWIRPEAASADEIAAAIERCPTGALRYVRDEANEAPQEPATIRAVPNGPLVVRGAFEVMDENGVRL